MNQMREEFEKWAKAECLDLDSVDGFYSDNDTHIAWGSWQAAQSAAVPVVGDVEALICDDCGAETNDPWHSSKGTNRHYHRCDSCNSITAAELDALRKDAERLDLLESAVSGAFVSACFELDGGVHLNIEAPGAEPKYFRDQASLRAAIDAAIAQGKGE